MTRFFIISAFAFTVSACGDKAPTVDDSGAALVDTGEEDIDDGVSDDGVSDAPGCYQESVACNAFTGPAWAGQEEASCQASSDYSVENGGAAMVYLAEGCPDGAVSVCSDLFGRDDAGNPVEAASYVMYFYSGISADQALASCDENGGSFAPF